MRLPAPSRGTARPTGACTRHAAPRPLPPLTPLQKPDLGGRLKIRGYYSTTTSSEKIRKNTRILQDVLQEKGIHQRPDFVVRRRPHRHPLTATAVDRGGCRHGKDRARPALHTRLLAGQRH